MFLKAVGADSLPNSDRPKSEHKRDRLTAAEAVGTICPHLRLMPHLQHSYMLEIS